MREKLLAITLIVCLSCFNYVREGSVRTWEAGVAKGDFFRYEMYGVFNFGDSDASFVIPPFERNNTEFVRIDITEVQGSTVNQRYTLHFNNGTETKFDLQTNLDPFSAGEFNFTEKGVPMCAADLKLGDPLPTLQLRVNQTLVKTYPSGEERDTNRVLWNLSDDWGCCDFDKKTGMLVELNRVHLFVNPSTGKVVSKTDVIKLTDSNAWTVNPPPTTVLPILGNTSVIALRPCIATLKTTMTIADRLAKYHLRKTK
jgi:hypothetical protein